MNGSSVGKGTWPSSATKQQKELVMRRHGSFEQMKEIHFYWNRGKERMIEIEAGKECGMRPGKSFTDPG